jgi:hypothetical protein
VSPPTEAAKVVDVVDGQKLPVCVYHSDNAVQWSLVAKDPDLIEVLACDADVDKCEAVLADNRARFAAPPSKPIIVFGYKSNPRAQYSATKSCPNDGRRCQAFESDPRPFAALQERPEEQVFTWDHDLDETKALCVPAVQKHQRSLPPEAPPGYLTVTADGSPISSPKSWRLENGERFCPVDVPPGEIDRMQAAWRSRKALWVSFLQAGTSIFRREYRKGSDLKISSIGFYHRDPKAGPVHQACYDATRTLFSEGGLLCVTVPDAGQKNAVSIDLDQIVLRDGVGGRILGRFYSSAGSIHGFRRERQASTPLFCTKLSTRESGEIGVRFAPEPDSPRGDVAFSFRDSVMGCTNAHGTAVACGSMDPQFWHLVWGKDAFSLGSVSLGGWFGITGNEEIRYRVVGLVPLVDAGLKVPNVVGGSLQTGVAVPFTLPGSAAAVTRDKPDGSANEESAADALIGVGVGPYLTGCVKLEVGNVPQACIGVSGEVGLERVERADDSQRREGYLQLSWFFAAGTGF